EELEDVIERRDIQLAELVAGDRLNRIRDGLNRLGATLRGYDDLSEAAGGRGRFPGGLLRAVGDSCMRAERGRDCRGNFVVGFQSFPLSFVVLKKNRERATASRGVPVQALRLIKLTVRPRRLRDQSQCPG